MKYYCNWIWSLNLFFCIGTIALDAINKRYYAIVVWGVVIALLFVTRTLAMRNIELEEKLHFLMTSNFSEIAKKIYMEEEKEEKKDEDRNHQSNAE